jgi:hypothetical protein
MPEEEVLLRLKGEYLLIAQIDLKAFAQIFVFSRQVIEINGEAAGQCGRRILGMSLGPISGLQQSGQHAHDQVATLPQQVTTYHDPTQGVGMRQGGVVWMLQCIV